MQINKAWGWPLGLGLAALVGVFYFLAARLSLGLLLEPDGVAVFWPAAGISSGVLIALGRAARWPVVIGVMAATIAANLTGDRNIWASIVFAACNAAEAVIAAGLIQRYFGTDFHLDQLHQVFGLAAAAACGPAISGVGAAIGYKLFHSPEAPILVTWQDWFASDGIGILTVAPLLIGLIATARENPPMQELLEGGAVLGVLAAATGFVLSLPRESWQTVVPEALLFPMLLWLAARCRPVFAATGAFIVSLTIVCTTIYGLGHFGDPSLTVDDRVLQARTMILFVTLTAFVLAALFAERKKSELRLAQLNQMLEREQDNKLMSLQAVVASISHEIKQPLTAIAFNGAAARQFINSAPVDLAEVRSALDDLINDSHLAGQILDNLHQLFGKNKQQNEPIDMNELVLSSLQVLHGPLTDYGVVPALALPAKSPLVLGQRTQLKEVLLNLFNNAIEAMAAVESDHRALKVRTSLAGEKTVVIEIEDSGVGIDPERLERIFEAFVTTKAQGTGLGLAISRTIIERHGGQLSAASDGRNGAVFQIVLPIEGPEIAIKGTV